MSHDARADEALPANSGYDGISIDFLALIGRIVIGWSRIERAMDIAIVSGKTLIGKHFEKGPPVAFRGKVRALRALCKALPSFDLKQLMPWVERRIDDLLVIAEKRHTIMHGYFHGISGDPEPQIYFRRAAPLTGEAGQRLVATRAELESLVAQIARADFDFMMIMFEVLNETRKVQKLTLPRPTES